MKLALKFVLYFLTGVVVTATFDGALANRGLKRMNTESNVYMIVFWPAFLTHMVTLVVADKYLNLPAINLK
jgi:hypothetical protein